MKPPVSNDIVKYKKANQSLMEQIEELNSKLESALPHNTLLEFRHQTQNENLLDDSSPDSGDISIPIPTPLQKPSS